MPWFYGWPLQLYDLIHVAIYFYFVSSFTYPLKWKPLYILLFIPWILSCIDVIEFYLKPIELRLLIVQNASLLPNERFDVNYGLFPIKIHYLIKHSTGFIAMISLLPSLIRFFHYRKFEKNKQIFNRWLVMLWILVVAIYMILFFGV